MTKNEVETTATDEAIGIIQVVDVPGRALTILVDGVPTVFDIAPDCAIALRGERVKLRLVQPNDNAHICYRRTPDGLSALAVEVS